MTATVKQVGGDHYQAPIQHWDLVEAHNLGYLEATASKYIVRYDKKGKPNEDLLKAKSYLERLLQENRGAHNLATPEALTEFLLSGGYNDYQCRLMVLIHNWGRVYDIKLAVNLIDTMLKEFPDDQPTNS